MEVRTGVDDAVEQRHRQADPGVSAAGGQAQAATRRAVHIDDVTDAHVQRRQNPRLTVDDEGD
jgi:hypothetical protein